MDLGAVSRGDCNDFCTPATHLWVPQYKVGGTVHSYCIKDACCNDSASAAVTRHWVRQYKAGGMDHILTVQSGWDGPHSYSTKWVGWPTLLQYKVGGTAHTYCTKWVGWPTLTVQSGWDGPYCYSTKWVGWPTLLQYKVGGTAHTYCTKWVGWTTLTVQSGWGSPHSYSTKVAKAAYLSTMVKRFPDSSPNRNCFSTYLLTTKRFHHISVDNQTFPSYIC